MLTEHDEMRARNGLGDIELSEELIRGRTGGTALCGEQFDEHRRVGMRQRSGCEQWQSSGKREARASRAANRPRSHLLTVAAPRRLSQQQRTALEEPARETPGLGAIVGWHFRMTRIGSRCGNLNLMKTSFLHCTRRLGRGA